MSIKHTNFIVTSALILSSASTAFAVCNQGSFSSTDAAIFNAHSGCNALAPDGVTWFPAWAVSDANYHVSSSDGWSNRGWNDACNLNKEFTKLWNSFFLIQNGILNNGSQSWHGREDYPFVAQGNVSNFHEEFFFKATDEQGIAHFHQNVFGDDEVVLECGSFNPGLFGDGAVRASSIVHEGWHAWQLKYGHSLTHPNNGSDYFFPHGVGEFEFGDLFTFSSDKRRFHSPSQAEMEFDCDLFISSQPWVPNAVKMASAGEGNRLADNLFVKRNSNGTFTQVFPAHCDVPRPFSLP